MQNNALFFSSAVILCESIGSMRKNLVNMDPTIKSWDDGRKGEVRGFSLLSLIHRYFGFAVILPSFLFFILLFSFSTIILLLSSSAVILCESIGSMRKNLVNMDPTIKSWDDETKELWSRKKLWGGVSRRIFDDVRKEAS